LVQQIQWEKTVQQAHLKKRVSERKIEYCSSKALLSVQLKLQLAELTEQAVAAAIAAAIAAATQH